MTRANWYLLLDEGQTNEVFYFLKYRNEAKSSPWFYKVFWGRTYLTKLSLKPGKKNKFFRCLPELAVKSWKSELECRVEIKLKIYVLFLKFWGHSILGAEEIK